MKKIFGFLLSVLCVIGFISGCTPTINSISNKLNTYVIDGTFDENTNILQASQTLDYTNNTKVVLKELDFHLYPNAFSKDAKNKPVSLLNQQKAYPNGIDYGNIDIKQVKTDNNAANFQIGGEDSNILIVPLNIELYPDDSVRVFIEYEVKLPNIIHRFGYGDNTYNFGNFYPVVCVYENGGFMTKPYNYNGDPFFSEMSNYEVTLNFSKDFIVAHTGDVVSQKEKENVTNVKIKARAVRDFAFVLSKKFKTLSQVQDKITVNYFYYDDENSQQSLQVALDSVKTFCNLFGDYPYKTLNVVQTNFIHGGMEYPNLVYISDMVDDVEEYQNVIVHEIAHQWWYNLVGSNAYDNAWQDEGLTEFSTILFYENNPQYQVDTKQRLSAVMANYLLFVDMFTTIKGEVDTSMNRPLDQYESEMEYVYITYIKGTLMFDSIRKVMGEDNFIKALKIYYKENIYTLAKPEDLIYALNKKCNKDMESFVNSWVEGKVVLQSVS